MLDVITAVAQRGIKRITDAVVAGLLRMDDLKRYRRD